MSRRDSLDVLKTRLEEIDRALGHGEWWLNRTKRGPRLGVTHIGGGTLTNAQEADRSAFVAKRMSRRRDRRS